MINIEKVSTGIVATPHNEDWQIEQLLPNLVFMGGDVRTIFNNPNGEDVAFDFTIEWYLEDVCVRSFFTDSEDSVISFDFTANFEFDKMVIKHPRHDDVEICFKVITETGTDIKKIDFFNVEDEETALFWQYVRTSLYRGESLTLDGEQFVTQDGKIIPIEQNPITKYNVVFGGVLGMPVWQAESLNAKFGNADFIKIDGGIFQIETPPALTFLSDNLVNVTIGGYFTTEQYRGAPLLPIIIPNDEIDPIFEQWKTDNAAYLGKLLDETPANPTTKVLNGSREWVNFPTPTIEHDQTRDKNGNPDFLHITQAEKDDFAIKAYAYERVNIAPTIALKLATQTAIIKTLTNANTFAITLPTPLLDKINESIITFKIGSTVPNITLPANLKWHTDKVVLAPMTTRTIVFEQLTFDGINYEVWASCDKQ